MCRLLFGLAMVAHERRRLIHISLTDLPTPASTAQQLREPFPVGSAPLLPFWDRDHVRRLVADRESDGHS